MYQTESTYPKHSKKQYVAPWIYVKNVDLRGGILGTSGEAGGTDPKQGETEEDLPGMAKESDMFLDNPFETDLNW